MPQSKKHKRRGTTFEKAVAAVQAMMDPKAQVEHNVRIRDLHGHLRQFDVVIRGKVGGHEILGVIECKDLKRKVGTPEVDAFVTKAQGVNANITLLASRRGFSKPALKEAKDYGIGTISLLPKDPRQSGFSVGLNWFAQIYAWKKTVISVSFVAKKAPVEKYSTLDIKYRGEPVVNWLQRELATTLAKVEQVGWRERKVEFKKPRKLQIGQKHCMVKGLTFRALRTCETKRRWVQLRGDAFFDWQTGKITIPPKGQIITDALRSDFSDWDDFEGEIRPSTGFLGFRLNVYAHHFDTKTPVVDVTKL